MPRVYKQHYTKPAPPNAPRKRVGGAEFVRRAGKWVEVHDGRITCTARVWYAEYRDADGRLRTRSTRCTDESAARGVLAEWVRRAELQRSGALSASAAEAAEHGLDALAPHVDAWVASMRAAGRSISHQKNSRCAVEKVAREIPWDRLGHLTYESFDRWLRADPDRSARSRNWYREALLAFCGWCVATHRLAANPFTAYPKSNVEADRQYRRRAFTGDELARLIAATEPRSLARALAYRVMALTGLRVSELRSLRVRDLVGATLILGAENEKARRGAVIPLRADLAERFAAWVAGRSADAPLIDLPASLAPRLQGDLRAAGLEQVDAAGYHLDAHSLRYTFCTALARAGVAPRVAQEAMRHSSPLLTAKVYTDPRLLAVAEAMERIDYLR